MKKGLLLLVAGTFAVVTAVQSVAVANEAKKGSALKVAQGEKHPGKKVHKGKNHKKAAEAPAPKEAPGAGEPGAPAGEPTAPPAN